MKLACDFGVAQARRDQPRYPGLKTHLLRVYEKLEAPNRSAAVAIALGRGMLRVGTATS